MVGSITYLRNVRDRLSNLVSGMGTSKDKNVYNRYEFVPLSQMELDAAYRGDWIARKIVDVPPYDMVRKWRYWQAEGDQIEALEEVERRFRIRQKVFRAMTRARLYGGAALFIGVKNSGPLDSELDVERVGKDSLEYLHVMSRWEASAGEMDRDILSPGFGTPLYYTASSVGNQVDLHPSRVVRFIGNELPDTSLYYDGWGDPVLQAVDDAVKNAGLTSTGIAALVHEAKVDVIKIPRLMENLATDSYTNLLASRLTLANQMKSMHNMLLMDAAEEWEQKTLGFDKLPDILQAYLQIAAGAADIPATRLLGQAPSGLNATGESDIRNYYDRLQSEQSVILCSVMETLDEVLIRSALGSRPKEIYYEWAPLWQMDEAQKATIFKTKAEGVQIYVNSALIPTDALAKAVGNMLVEDGALPGLEEAIEESALGTPEEFALGEKEKAEAAEEASQEMEMEVAKAKIAAPAPKPGEIPDE